MILQPSYLHNEISSTGKMTSLYWIGAQVVVSIVAANALVLKHQVISISCTDPLTIVPNLYHKKFTSNKITQYSVWRKITQSLEVDANKICINVVCHCRRHKKMLYWLQIYFEDYSFE